MSQFGIQIILVFDKEKFCEKLVSLEVFRKKDKKRSQLDFMI